MKVTIFLAIVFVALTASCAAREDDSNPAIGEKKIVGTVAIEAFDGSPKIFVTRSSPNSLRAKLSKMNRLEVLQFLNKIAIKDEGTLTALNREQSVIFAIFNDVNPGTTFRTCYTYSRSKLSRGSKSTDSPFTDCFFQMVEKNTITKPLLIINGTNSVFKGKFIYNISRDWELIAEREVIVPNDYR